MELLDCFLIFPVVTVSNEEARIPSSIERDWPDFKRVGIRVENESTAALKKKKQRF